MKNLIATLYEAKSENIILWKKIDSPDLSLKYDKERGLSDAIKDKIKQYKDKIKDILTFNKINSQEESDLTNYYSIPDNLRNYELSEIQKGIYLQSKIDSNLSTYNVPILIRVHCENEDKLKIIRDFESAITLLLKKHSILRMLVLDEFKYRIADTNKFEISKKTFSSDKLDKYIEEQSNLEFELDNGNLIKLEIINISSCDDLIINLTHHHILSDAYSTELLVDELLGIYLGLTSNSIDNNSITPQQLNYFDYQAYQEYILQTTKYKKAIHTLVTKLDNSKPLQLKHKMAARSNDGNSFNFVVGNDTYNNLAQQARENNLSLYAVLLSALHYTLSVFSDGSDDFPIGITISNRPYEFKNVIGPFIGMLPVLFKYNKSASIAQNISALNQEILYLNEHRDLNINVIAKESKKNLQEVMELMHIMFTMHNFNSSPDSTVLKDKIEVINVIEDTEKFGISILAKEINNGINFRISYSSVLYENSYIEAIFRSYENLLKSLSPSTMLTSFKPTMLLSKNAYQQIVYEWNNTSNPYPNEKTIHELFEDQVLRTPDNIAVQYEDTKLTYRDLNQRSNQLANYLKARYNIKGDDLVALCLDRSEHMLIGIIATLKSGAAYVPMDPSYPDDRIAYIIQDTKSRVVLTNEIHKSKLESILDNKIDILCIDEMSTRDSLSSQSSSNPKHNITSKNLAYVIYTSGTTGRPKGVMLNHEGIINRIVWMNTEYPLKESDCILQKTPYVFDVSVWELFWASWYGACIVFAKPEGHKDPSYLINTIDKYNISIVHFVPSMLEVFTQTYESMSDSKVLSSNSLHYIFCSGEALPLSTVKSVHNLFPKTEIHNLYGPTEASVDVLYYDCSNKDINSVFIGKPISNTEVYILDHNLTPLPIDAIGELYIGGVGLARGYLNQPELTSEKFIPNPFQSQKDKELGKNSRLYKTGDLARYLPDGNIEYIGRNDFQVKIRGFRIELGEIETKLVAYPGIKQSVVLALEHKDNFGNTQNNKYLVGYYVSDTKLDEASILKELQSSLPDYMIPSVLVHLDTLPLTINGKLDRKALPDPEFTNTNTYVAPRNDLEAKVCAVYAQTLGLDPSKVGIQDDFFRIGGNSILAIKLVSRLNNILHTKVSVASIFRHKTIYTLLDSVLSEDESEVVIIPKLRSSLNSAGLNNQYSLSFAQERLWFIESFEGGSNAYNIPLVYKLSQDTNIEALKSAIESVVSRHSVLHSKIKTDSDGNGYQEIANLDIEPLVIREYEFSNKEELSNYINKEINHIYDLSSEYPIRAALSKVNNDQSIYLNMVVHHIAFDGWSVDIFLRDLYAYYRYYVDKELDKQNNTSLAKLDLPELTIQYHDFASWQREYLSKDRLSHQLKYWSDKLRDYEGLNLPLDKPRPAQISYAGDDVTFSIDSDISNKLRNVSKELGVSLYSVLLSGFNLLLRSYSNQDDIVIGAPIANRHHSQLEDIVGFFVNSLALRSKIDANEKLRDYIKQIGNEVIEAQLHQDLPFERLVNELNIEKDTSRHPIFQVMFGIQNFGHQNSETNTLFESSGLSDYEILENVRYSIAKFDLTVMINDNETELNGSFNYGTSIFNRSTIEQLVATYIHILSQIASKANHKHQIRELSYLDETSYNKVINTWNQTSKEYPDNKTIHELFEEQALRTPDNIAVQYEDTKLTYRDLNQRSNQLANYLKARYNIKGDDLVALCLDRSEHMLIGIIATLKSGAAYVPMDPSYPDDRIAYIIQDTKSRVVLTNEIHKSKLESILDNKIDILCIDEMSNRDSLSSQSLSNPEHNITSKNLAYVIYTSGTTGRPKGVMIEHRNLVNVITSLSLKYNIQPLERILLFSNYIFDASIEQIFLPLLNKSTLVIPNTGIIKNGAAFLNFIITNKITHIEATPSYLELLDIPILSKSNITRLISGGEYFSPILYNKLREHIDTVVNVYGPTEASITALVATNNLSIGKPLYNYRLYILDTHLAPLPIGAIGELYIGGVGLARGYLNQPELTSEKFIPNPFQSQKDKELGKNSRLYKTGDLARYLPDGNIEYIGRNDFQVKIRGFRIELGEIETKLVAYPGIKQSVVLALEHKDNFGNTQNNKYLVGYYVSDTKLDEASILKELQSSLPDYMIPSVLVHLDTLPLTINGKLDRKALPDPEFTNTNTYVAPRNDLEAKVCVIYATVLNVTQGNISITDNFFHLGGNSLSVIKLVTQLKHSLKINIDFSFVYKHPTIKEISENIQEMSHSPLLRIIGNLDASNSKPIFILFHTARGSSEVYNNFVEYIKSDFDIILVNSHNLSQFITKDYIYDFNELCKLYFDALEPLIKSKIQVFIGGWSFGGLVAIGVVEQVLAYNNKFNLSNFNLVLFDSLPPDIVAKLVSEKSSEDIMDELYPSLSQKEVGAIHDKMYINYTLNTNIDHVKLSLIKAYDTNELISTFNENHQYMYYGFERYFKDINSFCVKATHETVFDEEFLSEMAKYIINLL